MSTLSKKSRSYSRTKRLPYLVFLLILTLLSYARMFLEDYRDVYARCEEWTEYATWEGASCMLGLMGFICGVSFWFCMRRRLHDCGYSGWWVWLVIFMSALAAVGAKAAITRQMMPPELGLAFGGAGLLISLVIGLIPSERRENRYGVFVEDGNIRLPGEGSSLFPCSIVSLVLVCFAAQYAVAALHVEQLQDYIREHYHPKAEQKLLPLIMKNRAGTQR